MASKAKRRNPFEIVPVHALTSWKWRMVSHNGTVLAHSGRSYRAPGRARRALAGVIGQLGLPARWAAEAPVKAAGA